MNERSHTIACYTKSQNKRFHTRNSTIMPNGKFQSIPPPEPISTSIYFHLNPPLPQPIYTSIHSTSIHLYPNPSPPQSNSTSIQIHLRSPPIHLHHNPSPPQPISNSIRFQPISTSIYSNPPHLTSALPLSLHSFLFLIFE